MAVHGIVEAFAIVSVFGITGGTITSVARSFFNRASKRGLSAPSDPQLLERLDRIEAAVQSIAIETERISEGQRFTTRLLADTASAPLSSHSPPAIPTSAGGDHRDVSWSARSGSVR